MSKNIHQLQTHQTTVRITYFYSRRPGVWKRGTHHSKASIRNINLAVTRRHTTQTEFFFNCNCTSNKLGECKVTKIFWLLDGSPLQVRINPVGNLPTVVVIPIPARTAEFANLFVTLTIAGRNLATPILDTTKNQRLVDLLAYMKTNLGTYTGVSLINLLHETCNLYDLELSK